MTRAAPSADTGTATAGAGLSGYPLDAARPSWDIGYPAGGIEAVWLAGGASARRLLEEE